MTFGNNQKIVLAAIAVPFIAATAFIVAGKGDVVWWGDFVGSLVKVVVGVTVGTSGAIKIAEAVKGPRE